MCFRCVTVQQTARIPQTHTQAQRMNRAVGAGPPGVPGAPVLPPVDQAPEAGRGSVHLETPCSTVPGRPLRSRSASTPPAPVRQRCSPSQSSVPNASLCCTSGRSVAVVGELVQLFQLWRSPGETQRLRPSSSWRQRLLPAPRTVQPPHGN